MFEQTLLTQPAPAQKTGAFAISLTAQMCVLGVLIVGPLLYTQALPLIVPPLPVLVFRDPPPPPPPVRTTTTTVDQPASTGAPTRRIWIPQTSLAPLVHSETPSVSFADVIVGDLTPEIGAPLAIGGPVVELSSVLPREPAAAKATTVATAVVEAPAKPVNLSGGVLASKLITKVLPQYPSAAKAVRVSGVVRLLAIIGQDGRVRELRVLDGPALLRRAAEDAVRQWVYSPTYLSGRPVEVEAPIEVKFELN